MTEPTDDVDAEVLSIEAEQHPEFSRERDGISSLRDVEAEQDEDEGIEDLMSMDDRAAKEVGAALDSRGEPEPRLD